MNFSQFNCTNINFILIFKKDLISSCVALEISRKDVKTLPWTRLFNSAQPIDDLGQLRLEEEKVVIKNSDFWLIHKLEVRTVLLPTYVSSSELYLSK